MERKNKIFLGIGTGVIVLVVLIIILINVGVTFHLEILSFRIDVPNPNKDLKLTNQIDETLRNQIVNDLIESREFYKANLENLDVIKDALNLSRDYEDMQLKVGINGALRLGSNVTSEEILHPNTTWYFKENQVTIVLHTPEREGLRINAVKIGDKWFWW